MAKKLDDEKLPPSYINLGFDTAAEPGPSAPRNEEESDFYEERTEVPIPSAPIQEVRQEPRTLTYRCAPTLVFEDIYEACLLYVKRHCCYGSRFLRQMKLIEINNSCVFQYILESFGEKRESANSNTPFHGQYIDGPENGRPPDPWSIRVEPAALFEDSNTRMEIPHTAYVTVCGKCHGTGKVRCSSCSGSGKNKCYSCSGSGRKSEGGSCASCSGSGYKRCIRCSGRGLVRCSKCAGHGKIKCYKVLIVTWTNHTDGFTSNTAKLPAHKIGKVTGERVFFEEENKLLPIVNAPDVSVNVASTNLIKRHENAFPSELILKQRHKLRAVPFTTVKYQWKDVEDEFYVYGKEKEVYFETYPQPCCCCTCC